MLIGEYKIYRHRLKGGMLKFGRFRGTLTSIRASVVSELPEKLVKISFEKNSRAN